MDIDLEKVLKEFVETSELPEIPAGELFTTIYKKWVEQGGRSARGKILRSIAYLRKVLGSRIKSIYPKLVGKMSMDEKDLVLFLSLFFREWYSEVRGTSGPHPIFVTGRVGVLARKLLDERLTVIASGGLNSGISTSTKVGNEKVVEVNIKVPIKLLPATFTFSIVSSK